MKNVHRLALALASVGAAAGCVSVVTPPFYDPGIFARVGPGAPAAQVRSVLGRPTTAMPAMSPPPELVSTTYPGCNSAAEEWEYLYANCDVKLIFDDEGKLCNEHPAGACVQRRMQ